MKAEQIIRITVKDQVQELTKEEAIQLRDSLNQILGNSRQMKTETLAERIRSNEFIFRDYRPQSQPWYPPFDPIHRPGTIIGRNNNGFATLQIP